MVCIWSPEAAARQRRLGAWQASVRGNIATVATRRAEGARGGPEAPGGEHPRGLGNIFADVRNPNP